MNLKKNIKNFTEPKLIAPVVVYLCHESNPSNGDVIVSAAGWAGKVRYNLSPSIERKIFSTRIAPQLHLIQSQGSVIRASLNDEPTPENVQREWRKITDMSNAKHMHTSADAMKNLMEKLEHLGEDQNNNRKVVSDNFSFGSKDLILYALGSELLRPVSYRCSVDMFK